jgi:A/G-specific adenine glycosylase
VFDMQEPARSPQGEKILWGLAAANLPPWKSDQYNQALMDLGASICTPRNPNCPACPLGDICQAYAQGIQDQRPVRSTRRQVPHYTVTAAVIQRHGNVLIARRPENGLLGGMWEFPGGKLQEGEDLPSCLRREIQEELGVDIQVANQLGIYQHAYTHFRVTLHAFRCTLGQAQPRPLQASDLRWVAPSKLQGFPMGKIDRQIARDIS